MILLVISSILWLQAYEIDVNTFSNYLDVQNRHLHLEWLLNMDKKYINASSSYSFQVVGRSINKISLGIYKFNIYSTYFKNDRTYYRREYIEISIKYSIDSRSRSISFMTKEQTSTKIMPYLFSQCEDANCRALAPLQDTPAVKQTYIATIIYKDIEATDVFMSADESQIQFKILNKPLDEAIFTRKQNIFHKKFLYQVTQQLLQQYFYDNIKKVKTSTGDRTFLVSEPDKIVDYAKKLEDMESFLQPIEEYIRPYTWSTYPLVIQPPSFPIGGMQNPLLTFENPSIMIGTGNGLAVIIHEMAHSWFGNTITCVNWATMWINEGFIVFLERKASLIHYKVPDDIKLNAIIGNISMNQDMLGYGLDSNFSSLHPDTTGLNPDDSLVKFHMKKDFNFQHIQNQLWGKKIFNKCFKHIQHNININQLIRKSFRPCYQGFYKKKMWRIILQRDIRFQRIGINRYIPQDFHQIILIFRQVNQQMLQIILMFILHITVDGKQHQNWKGGEDENFSHSQKQVFLEDLFKKAENNLLKQNVIDQIDKDLKLTNENDYELKFRCLDQQQETKPDQYKQQISLDLQEKRALNTLDHQFAVDTFRIHEAFYHPIARNNIINIL